MTAATPGQAALRLAVITEIREAASCESDDGDQCPKCTRHAGAILAVVAAQELHAAAGGSSSLGLKHAVTSNRLGHALAALCEIRDGDGADSSDLTERASMALADDAAIRDNVALTREPQPAPGLAAALDDFNFERNQVIELRAMLSSLTGRAEASGAITGDEADEYRAALGVPS